ncbi:TetR/AcrR family transcriptional regulator, partial [Escherichia coli]|uniref:TetR/AcrR family transcriptional regulator n=2 Tax=Gammaproteobacteria TaxID=1236 RepID=UPI0034D95AE0
MNQNDLRVIKTEQHIEQAFLALLQQKPYRAITVQDILDTAAINRSTFYRHYASKEA